MDSILHLQNARELSCQHLQKGDWVWQLGLCHLSSFAFELQYKFLIKFPPILHMTVAIGSLFWAACQADVRWNPTSEVSCIKPVIKFPSNLWEFLSGGCYPIAGVWISAFFLWAFCAGWRQGASCQAVFVCIGSSAWSQLDECNNSVQQWSSVG